MQAEIIKNTRPAHYKQIDWLKAYIDKIRRKPDQFARAASYWRYSYLYDYMKMRHRGEVMRLEE